MQKYSGPDLETLPAGISGRVQSVLKNLPSGSGVYGCIVRNPSLELSGFKEVFVYDFGDLERVFINSGDVRVVISFFGSADFEEAFGLKVMTRPADNQSPAEILCEGTPLERMAGLGHPPAAFENSRLRYELGASGPYMGRK